MIDVPVQTIPLRVGIGQSLTTVMEKKELAQWYLVQRQGDYIISFVCTFPPDRQADIENFPPVGGSPFNNWNLFGVLHEISRKCLPEFPAFALDNSGGFAV